MYDNFCKYLIETYPDDFATWLLGKVTPLTKLEPTELITEPIRADSLLLQGEDVVLHVEFQTGVDAEIPERMANYYLRIRKKFTSKRIVQVVVYLRQTGSPLVEEAMFRSGGMTHRFRVIRLWEQPKAVFWNAPGLLPLAILSKAANQDAAGLLEEMKERISEVTTDVGMQGNLEMATALFAGLKLKLDVIKRVMRSRAMRESVFYQDLVQEHLERGRREGEQIGIQKGEQIGIQKGEQIGIQKGEQRGIRKGYIKLLRQLVPLFEGVGVPMEPWLKRLGVDRSELDED